MFTKTAEYYDALYQFKDYQSACDQLNKLVKQFNPSAKTLLDVGCGTGKHLQYLSEYFKTEGLDLDDELLEVARNRIPDVRFHHSDMTNFSLSSKFDVVTCLFSSIAYVRTVENLNKAIKCMVNHLNANGILFVEPWIWPENYWIDKLTFNQVDEPDLKIAWMYVSKKEDATSIFDIHYMVGTPDGINQFTEKHVMGLWTDEEYRAAFAEVGIEVIYDPVGLFGRGMYYGMKK